MILDATLASENSASILEQALTSKSTKFTFELEEREVGTTEQDSTGSYLDGYTCDCKVYEGPGGTPLDMANSSSNKEMLSKLIDAIEQAGLHHLLPAQGTGQS